MHSHARTRTHTHTHTLLQSAGPQKESKSSHKEKGKKKKQFDTTQSSNSKLKYQQKKGEKTKDVASLAKQTHKQLPPTIALVHKRTGGGEQEGEKLEAVEEEGDMGEVGGEGGGEGHKAEIKNMGKDNEVDLIEEPKKEERGSEGEPGGDFGGEVSFSGNASFSFKNESDRGGLGEMVEGREEVEAVEELNEEEKELILEEERSIQQLERVSDDIIHHPNLHPQITIFSKCSHA